MSYASLVKLSTQAAELTASACASCAVNDPYHHCCKGCAFSQGYFHDVKQDALDAIKLKYGWDKTEGFATNVGCRLPREVRSPTCLAFYCNPIKQKPTLLGFEPTMQHLRNEKGFKNAVLPNKLASLLGQALTGSTDGHHKNIAIAIDGRNSI